MSINRAAIEKGINEIIHFTTNAGLLGILTEEAILSNAELKESDTLAFIFWQNSEQRKERNQKWLNYVNLSVSKLNQEFFSYSEYRHSGEQLFWVILSFSTQLLDDAGIYFATTNNIYPSCIRGEGIDAFNGMFAPSIEGKFQKTFNRTSTHLSSWTTCEQAEILYPNSVPLRYLQKIYVRDVGSRRAVMAQLMALDKTFEVCIAPEKFTTTQG